MGGSSPLLLGSSIALHSRLELLTRSESDHPACLDRDLFSGLGITTRSLLLVTQIKIAKPGNLYLLIDRKSTRLNSSHVKISYAVFCLKKKNIKHTYKF